MKGTQFIVTAYDLTHPCHTFTVHPSPFRNKKPLHFSYLYKLILVHKPIIAQPNTFICTPPAKHKQSPRNISPPKINPSESMLPRKTSCGLMPQVWPPPFTMHTNTE